MTAVTSPELIATARLFARLLLRELDDELLAALRRPEVSAALRDLDIAVPADGEVEDLRARYCELFLHPAAGAPPIASLWIDGQYEGDAAVALRRVSAAAGHEFVADAAAGAPPDHLGCILLLWGSCAEGDADQQPLADLLARDYLAWADRALAAAAADDGFYGAVAGAVCELIGTLRTDAQRS